MADISDEELEALRQKAAEVDAFQADKEELEKLRKKDFNFRQLEKGSAEEREKMKKEVDAKEKVLTEREQMLADVKTEIELKHSSFVQSQLSSAKREVLSELSGGDKALEEKLEFHAGTILGEMNTKEEMRAKYEKAYLLEVGTRPQINPLAASQGSSTGYTRQQPKKFTETEQGKAAFNNYFPDLATIRNKK